MAARLAAPCRRAPLEESEQAVLALWLDSRRYGDEPLLWFHCANEGKRSPRYGAKLKRIGLKRGVPDNWILDPPPNRPGAIGCVFELKRSGREYRKPSTEQQRWLCELSARRYVTFDAKGFEDAKRQLLALGY